MNRNENLNRLATEDFDIVIIGGGASGAGCALDAVLRGYKVALIEKADFGSGTSSRSTKLIHGGVRYLEQAFKNLDFAQLKQVRHGLSERRILLKNAPHLARPLSLITPVFSWWEGFYYSLGLKLYSFFSPRGENTNRTAWLSKKQAFQRIPTLNQKIHSAVEYFDGQMDDARYCLALIQTASESGAIVANYTQVLDFQKDTTGKILSAEIQDLANDKKIILRGKLFINCTGVWADKIRGLAEPNMEPRIQPSKGVHIVLPKSVLPSKSALLIPKTKDGRMIFAIPFQDQIMVGTTDSPWTHADEEPKCTNEESDFLLETLQPYLNQKIEKSQIQASFGGLRPLILAAKKDKNSTKTMLRDHEVEYLKTSNLISLLGGKWTTYRLMAQDAIDAADAFLGEKRICQTADKILAGGEAIDQARWQKTVQMFDLQEDTSRHLLANYGSRAEKVVKLIESNSKLGQKIHPDFPYILAELSHARQREMCLNVEDFLKHRIRLGILNERIYGEVLAVIRL